MNFYDKIYMLIHNPITIVLLLYKDLKYPLPSYAIITEGLIIASINHSLNSTHAIFSRQKSSHSERSDFGDTIPRPESDFDSHLCVHAETADLRALYRLDNELDRFDNNHTLNFYGRMAV